MARKPATDPVAILEQIAADPEASSVARVQACKALLAIRRAADKNDDAAPSDAVTTRALKLLKGGKA